MSKDTSLKKESTLEEDKNAQIQKEPEKPKEAIVMKKGDYTVHVLIEEIKNCISIDEDKLPFPVVKITCFNQSKRTEKLPIAAKDYHFAEHFYYDKTNLTAEMLDSEKILIEAYDSQNSKRKDYFGIYEFDFEYIYNRPEHALKNFWLALANAESDDISKVRGYLKLSISVLHVNDPRVELEVSEEDSTDCLIPSQIKVKYEQISIYFFIAEELPDMDSGIKDKKVNRECDGYVEVHYMGIKRTTSIRKMEKEKIKWNQVIDIPVSIPAVSQKIVMIVKDHDNIGKDDIVGSIEIKVDDILADKYNKFNFVNIYGSPVNKTGGVYDLMNFNAELGSKWKGRILIKIEHHTVDSLVSQMKDIEDLDLINQVSKLPRTNMWSINVILYSTLFLPEQKGDFGVRICIQDNYHYYQPKKATDRNIEWWQEGRLTCLTLSDQEDELPDLFIYLTNKEGENICFQRIPAKTFHNNYNSMIIKLLPDPAIGKVKNMMLSGLVKIKIHIALKSKDPPIDFSKFNDIKRKISYSKGMKKVEDFDDDDLENLTSKKKSGISKIQQVPQSTSTNFSIAAIVYMSKELIAADSDGTSDPYVELSLGEITRKTKIQYNTVNGIWNEMLRFDNIEFDLKDESTWPIFLLNVMDHNKVLSDTPIGYNYVWLSTSAHSVNSDTLISPKWHNLFLPKSNKQQGKIMLSFYIFDDANINKINTIKYLPECIPYTCEINILGLRQLKPLSVFPVKKAFIKFDMNSLNVTGKPEYSLQPIVTVPSDPGSDPNINSIIKFDANLPKNHIFIPDLQCEVYDHLLSGMMNSLLGVFTLDVKKIIKKTNKQIDEDTKVSKNKMGLGFLGMMMDKKNEISEEDKKKSNDAIDDPFSGGGMFSFKKKKEEDKESEKESEVEISTEKSRELSAPLIDKPPEDSKESKDIKVPIKSKAQTELVDQVSPPKRMINGKEVIISKEELMNNKDEPKYFVLFPVFKKYEVPRNTKDKTTKDFLIEDKNEAPDAAFYFSLGYQLKVEEDQKPEDSKKHYRRIFREPLENVKKLNLKSPFTKAKLIRGKYEDKASEIGLSDALKNINSKIIMTYDNGISKVEEQDNKSASGSSLISGPSQEGFMGNNAEENAKKNFGKFKGLIRICEKAKMDSYLESVKKTQKTEMIKDFKNLNKFEEIRQKILCRKSVFIRVYILELNNLAKKDAFSESDPYITLKLGEKEVVNEKKNYHEDEKNCKWYKYYDLPTEIPGSGALTIQVWDYDDLLADELIGETIIDLEDRYFDSEWQKLPQKPIEVRPLIHPDHIESQGEISLWVEIIETEKRSDPLSWRNWNIEPEPTIKCEARFVVWETENMEMMDVEGTSDIYVIGYIDMKNRQSTDIHFRCQTGNASFNWRMLLPIESPKTPNKIEIQVYDKDIFASDDFICGASLNISNLMEIPKYLDLPIKFTREYFNNLTPKEKEIFKDIEFMKSDDDPDGIKFWVQCYKNSKKGGRVLCTLEILPQWRADLAKVGKGRDEPNLDPYLPPPVGRFEWSLNPFKMLNQCVGPKFRAKMYCFICLCLILTYLAVMLPYILINGATNLIF